MTMCMCTPSTADGTSEVALLEYNRLTEPGLPERDVVYSNDKHYIKTRLSDDYWTADRAETAKNYKYPIVCQIG